MEAWVVDGGQWTVGSGRWAVDGRGGFAPTLGGTGLRLGTIFGGLLGKGGTGEEGAGEWRGGLWTVGSGR